MPDLLSEPRFDFISPPDKEFIRAFDREMARLGFDYGGKIGSGYCWGQYMLIYRKTGVKSDNVYARIYIREASILLRLFLSKIDAHRAFIEEAPAYIKEVFTGDAADCKHDRVDPDGGCMFRKTYTIDGRLIEKCSGFAFEFPEPARHGVGDYIALFSEFYAPRRGPRVAVQ